MGKPCTSWLVFCILGMLSIPIMGCGRSTAASRAPVTGTPSITWNPPATIQYGAALSDVELDATASGPRFSSVTLCPGLTEVDVQRLVDSDDEGDARQGLGRRSIRPHWEQPVQLPYGNLASTIHYSRLEKTVRQLSCCPGGPTTAAQLG
jgi:hypothetical protein